ncbi:MAG: ATP-binding protein [Pseudomonadota bacterium]|jgi:DNA polymerase-3 subunit delta'
MPLSSTNCTLIGHSHQRKALAALVAEERLPSSLIFSGPAGVGKRLVARELAARLLCIASEAAPPLENYGGCGECQACRLIRSGNHPDLRTLEWSEEGLSVDDLRSTLEKLSLRPFLGLRKVTILNDADNISTVGANILLKTLEEPRPENFFILIVTTPSRLPQTVLSRCQRWFFDRLSDSELDQIASQHGASEEQRALIPFANGSCAALESIHARSDLPEQITAALDAAWRGDIATIAKAAQDWAADKTGMRERITFLRTAIRERLLNHAADPNAATVWAHALQNAIDAEYLVLDRHVNATLAILAVLKSCNQKLGHAYQTTPNSVAPVWERALS